MALVESGLAWHYTAYSDDPELALAEEAAEEANRGIWSLANPLPPWRLKEMLEIMGSSPSGITYHGNVNSKVFHSPACRSYYCKNCTQKFDSKEAAIKAGFRPGKRCNP